MLTIFLALLTLPAHAADITVCLDTAKACADVDIDHPRAEEAFRKGCDANDAYACARLGQYYEVKKSDLAKAAPFYERACKGKDSFGCEQTQDLHQRLCFLEEVKKFCDGREPVGEFRVYRFLKTLDQKYADGFDKHDFDNGWSHDEVGKLFDKLVKEKNKALLKALLRQRKKHRHDGGDGESLEYQIECIQKKCPEYDTRERAFGSENTKGA